MKKIVVNQYLITVLRVFLGVLFIAAALPKIARPDQFAVAVDNYKFLPTILVNFWAIVLPWVEVAIGTFLIAGVFVEAAALISGLLYLSFIIALSAALARGLDIGCGCFKQGDTEGTINWLYLVRDSSLMLASIWVLFGYRGKLALESLWRKSDNSATD